MTNIKIGTIKELAPYVKVGDTLECVTSKNQMVWTVGKRYKILPAENYDFLVECDLKNPQASSISTFRIVDTGPKLWGQMSPEEKGALLLAFHEGKRVEFLNKRARIEEWIATKTPLWSIDLAYRVAPPEPKVEVITLTGSIHHHWGFIQERYVCDTHRITFNTIDGEPDLSSVKMEKI